MQQARKLAAIRECLVSCVPHGESLLRNAACGALLLGIGWTTWQLVLETGVTRRPEITAAASFPATPPLFAGDPGAGLAAMHLFGVPPAETRDVQAVADVTIVGIAHGSEPESSVAILLVNGVQQSYPVGGTLVNGEHLVGIEAHRVIFERNGRRRNLDFAPKQADPNADFSRPESVGVPVGFGVVETIPERSALAGNPASPAAGLQASRQNLAVPSDGLAGKRVESAVQIRAAHRTRVVIKRD